MINHKLLLRLLSILISITTGIVAREAIVHGDKAGVDQFPYQVTLMHDNDNFCGGGIIGDQFILSAAHCFISTDGKRRDIKISIRAGTNDLHRTTLPAVTLEILKVYVLEDYVPENPEKLGDIAVIKLKQRLHLSTHLQKLELPKHKESFSGKKAVIAGFGWHWNHGSGDIRKGGYNDTHLRFIEVNVFNFMSFGLERHPIPDQVLHGKAKQLDRHRPRGVCLGDSGSPLVLGKTVIGILSRASAHCSETEIGALYVSVSHFLDFIHDSIHDKPHDYIKVYTFDH